MNDVCKNCSEGFPARFTSCPLCEGNWECYQLKFASLPIDEVRKRLSDWAAILTPPSIISIEAGEDGLFVRLYTKLGAGHGPAAAWASSSRQHSHWEKIDHKLPVTRSLFALTSPALLPVLANENGEPFLSVGAGLLSLHAAQSGPTRLFITLHGRDDRLQDRLRALFSYATGTEKGVDDDTPNPWDLRLRAWQFMMIIGATIAALGGAAVTSGWIPSSAAGLITLCGGLIALTGFLGTQHWMQMRSLPQQVVLPRIQGALLRTSIAIDTADPNHFQLIAGEQRWVSVKQLWPNLRRYTFPLPASDITSLISPLEGSEGTGLLAQEAVQQIPAPAPSRGLIQAPSIIGKSPITGDPIGIDSLGHTLVVGGSRTGKSSAVFNLLRGLLTEVGTGPGMFLVDPHGSLADAFLHCIDLLPREEREAAITRLRIITPQSDVVVPLNPLVLPDFNWAGNALVQAGNRIWHDFWGPRMQAALLALSRLVHAWNMKHQEAGMGLMHTIPAAYNPTWRSEARKYLLDSHQPGIDALNALLGQHDSSAGRQKPGWITEVISPIISKLMALELSPWLFNSMHQNGFVDMEKWIHEKAWIIIRLPAGEMGQEAARLTAGMVYNIFEAAFRKVTVRGPVPFNFIIDEVQEIGGAMALESLLSEGGKFGARMFVLAQSLSLLRQIEGFRPVVQALLANTSAQIFFSPDPDDADIVRETLSLEARFGSTTNDIPSLQAWLRARLKGHWQPPTLVQIRPLVSPDPARVERVISEVIRAHPEIYEGKENMPDTTQSVMKSLSAQNNPSEAPGSVDSRHLGW